MPRPLITLTTDFGQGSPYVAIMKGVIWSINPDAVVEDITHCVPPQDVMRGALVLEELAPWFPEGTIHVAVVDPGVGSDRKILCATIAGRHYIAPDNGLLSGLARPSVPSRIIALTRPQYWLPDISATFHGRDIMAPVAAHLSLGVRPEDLGTAQTNLVQLEWPEVHVSAGKLEGVVESVDSFGNLVTNLTADMLGGVPRDERVQIECDEHETQGIFRTYSDQPAMTLIALMGSSGKLELAIVGESAAMMLGIKPGAKVTVKW